MTGSLGCDTVGSMTDTMEAPPITPKSVLLFELGNCLQEQETFATQERDLIVALRNAKTTWQELADVYGITRQAVHSKWSPIVKEASNGTAE